MTKLDRLLDIMRALRDPDHGCPWDRQQTFATIVPHTLEEAYEVADCIEHQGLDGLAGELGDLLFQVVFYAQLADEQNLFSFADVVRAIEDKLVARHPHVFAQAEIADAETQSRAWEAYKALERERSTNPDKGALAGVALALPALSRAAKIQQRASRVGFDWPDSSEVKQKVYEELDELEAAVEDQDAAAVAEEMGDLLFACVNWARHLDVNAETALRAATQKFERRFRFVETQLHDAGVDITGASLEAMDGLWEEAKRIERGPPKKTGA